jgi:hypothetical protein
MYGIEREVVAMDIDPVASIQPNSRLMKLRKVLTRQKRLPLQPTKSVLTIAVGANITNGFCGGNCADDNLAEISTIGLAACL